MFVIFPLSASLGAAAREPIVSENENSRMRLSAPASARVRERAQVRANKTWRDKEAANSLRETPDTSSSARFLCSRDLITAPCCRLEDS